MYPLGFNGLKECRLLNIFEPGVCPVWIMWVGIIKLNLRIISKDDIEIISQFPCLLGHPVDNIMWKIDNIMTKYALQ